MAPATRNTDCCGAPVRDWHSQGAARADETLCDECGEPTCSHCASTYEQDSGYGDDGQEVHTRAICSACKPPEPDPDARLDDEREAERLERETLARDPWRVGRD